MNIKRTVFETTTKDKAKVVTHFAEGDVPGSGFTALLIGGTLQDGTKEILELRFKTNFLPHISKLQEGLTDLVESEKVHKKGFIEAAQSLVDGTAADRNVPFKKTSVAPISTPALGDLIDKLTEEEIKRLKNMWEKEQEHLDEESTDCTDYFEDLRGSEDLEGDEDDGGII